MKKLVYIRPLRNCNLPLRNCNLPLGLLKINSFSWCDFFHSHKDFVDSSDIFLDFRDVILKDCQLDSFRGLQPRHNSCILISDIFINYIFNSFDFIKSMVKPYNLTNKLGSFWNKAVMNNFIDRIKFISKSIVNWWNSMKLGVMGTHYCTIITNQLIAANAIVP